MGARKPLTQIERRAFEKMRRRFAENQRTITLPEREKALVRIAETLVLMRCPHETSVAKQRYVDRVVDWIIDEGGMADSQMVYWIDVVLEHDGRESFLDALFEVMVAIDRVAAHSILRSLDQVAYEPIACTA